MGFFSVDAKESRVWAFFSLALQIVRCCDGVVELDVPILRASIRLTKRQGCVIQDPA